MNIKKDEEKEEKHGKLKERGVEVRRRQEREPRRGEEEERV